MLFCVCVFKELLVMSSITKELELKETRQELETHRQEHSDQQQVWSLSVTSDRH